MQFLYSSRNLILYSAIALILLHYVTYTNHKKSQQCNIDAFINTYDPQTPFLTIAIQTAPRLHHAPLLLQTLESLVSQIHSQKLEKKILIFIVNHFGKMNKALEAVRVVYSDLIKKGWLQIMDKSGLSSEELKLHSVVSVFDSSFMSVGIKTKDSCTFNFGRISKNWESICDAFGR